MGIALALALRKGRGTREETAMFMSWLHQGAWKGLRSTEKTYWAPSGPRTYRRHGSKGEGSVIRQVRL